MSFPEKKFKKAMLDVIDSSVTNPDNMCGFWARWGFSEGFQQGVDFGRRSAKAEFWGLLAEQRKEAEKNKKLCEKYSCAYQINDSLLLLLGFLEERLK